MPTTKPRVRKPCPSDYLKTLKQFRCIRCGIDVHERGAACRDCRSVAPDLVRKWRKM